MVGPRRMRDPNKSWIEGYFSKIKVNLFGWSRNNSGNSFFPFELRSLHNSGAFYLLSCLFDIMWCGCTIVRMWTHTWKYKETLIGIFFFVSLTYIHICSPFFQDFQDKNEKT